MNEVSISQIIKQLRVLNAAAHLSMSKEQWKELKSKHEIMAYSDLDSDLDAPSEKDASRENDNLKSIGDWDDSRT